MVTNGSSEVAQGQLFYNRNKKVQQGILTFSSQNQNGYWFRWQDNIGTGRLLLDEYTDGSLRGPMFIDEGTNPGKLLGDRIGMR